MTALIRSELRKVTATRLAAGLLAAALLIVALGVGFTLWGPAEGGAVQVEGAPTTLAAQGDVTDLLNVTGVLSAFALLFGAVFTTAEFRHRTAATTFLARPRRWQVLAAKAVAAAIVAAGYLVAATVLALGLMWLATRLDGTTLPLGAEVAGFIARSGAVMMLAGLLGVGVGAAIRSQVGAVVAILLWLFVIESLLSGLLPDLARWAPFSAAGAITSDGGPDTHTPATAAVLVSAYAMLALAVGTWLTEHRDAT